MTLALTIAAAGCLVLLLRHRGIQKTRKKLTGSVVHHAGADFESVRFSNHIDEETGRPVYGRFGNKRGGGGVGSRKC